MPHVYIHCLKLCTYIYTKRKGATSNLACSCLHPLISCRFTFPPYYYPFKLLFVSCTVIFTLLLSEYSRPSCNSTLRTRPITSRDQVTRTSCYSIRQPHVLSCTLYTYFYCLHDPPSTQSVSPSPPFLKNLDTAIQ